MVRGVFDLDMWLGVCLILTYGQGCVFDPDIWSGVCLILTYGQGCV